MHLTKTSPGSLYVKKSTLPGAGKGLFTKLFIRKGTIITEYKGKITSWEDADHDDGKNAYIYYVNKYRVIDASKNKQWLARYANDAKGLKQVKGLLNNSTYIIDENEKVFIKAFKNIPAGSEILVSYGKKYWEVINKYRKEGIKF